jgi:anaphase-promoting complex subunit 2
LSLLFELFGSDSDFIEEYENLLAEKLLLCKVPDLNEEIKNIELLKVRFGEAKMIRSAIIQRDIDDSARFNVNFKEMLASSRKYSSHLGLTPLNSSINVVSTGYWPINYDTSHFEYPPAFKQIFNEIDEQFKKHKPIMMLEHHNNLGSVELELKFKNGNRQ